MEGSQSAKTTTNVKVVEGKSNSGESFVRKHEATSNENECTLFVRNIGWDTTE